MNRKKIAYFVLLASFALFVINLSELDFKNLKNNYYSGIVSNVLLIIAMILTLRDIKRKG